jgi:hypothetical protein
MKFGQNSTTEKSGYYGAADKVTGAKSVQWDDA